MAATDNIRSQYCRPATHVRIGPLDWYNADGAYTNETEEPGQLGFGLDFMIYMLFFRGQTRPGTYVELGAENGIHWSNTLFFHKYLGWDGILIEPTRCARQVKVLRSHDHVFRSGVCTTRTKLNVTGSAFCPYVQPDSVEMVDCVPIRDLISEAKVNRIDFFSIDVEEFFYNVVSTIDFTTTYVDVMLIELWPVKEEAACKALLTKHGFVDVGIAVGNTIYRNKLTFEEWKAKHRK